MTSPARVPALWLAASWVLVAAAAIAGLWYGYAFGERLGGALLGALLAGVAAVLASMLLDGALDGIARILWREEGE